MIQDTDMKNKGGNVRSILIGILGLLTFLASALLPLLDAFSTARGYESVRGSLEVGNAFGFIFGTEIRTSVTIGVGQASTTFFKEPVSFNPPLYSLLGYVLILAGSSFAIAAFVLVCCRHKKASVFLSSLTFGCAIAGGILLLLSKEAMAMAYFNVSSENAKTIIGKTGFKLGPGILWPGILSFVATPLSFGSALLSKSKN